MSPTNRRATDRRHWSNLQDRIRHARRLAQLSQNGLAESVGVHPSAVAQWELPNGTCPTVEHLVRVAKRTGVSFEWLATGRGDTQLNEAETPAIDLALVANDGLEERLLLAFRRYGLKRRASLVRWLEEFA